MKAKIFYALSFFLALALHAGVVVLLMMDWGPTADAQPIKDEPYYIKASVVNENPHRAKKEKQKRLADERARRLKAKREADRKAAEKAAEINRKRIKEAELKALLEKQKAEAEVEKTKQIDPAPESTEEDAAKLAALESARQKLEMELQLAINEEAGDRLAVTDDEQALAYVAQIKRDIVQNWSRPPSARNGMQALLRVFLVPTGEVVNVTVEESSGNDAFDRSAMLAVRKAGRFIVPTIPRQFEKNFREFEVLFRPEDLRL